MKNPSYKNENGLFKVFDSTGELHATVGTKKQLSVILKFLAGKDYSDNVEDYEMDSTNTEDEVKEDGVFKENKKWFYRFEGKVSKEFDSKADATKAYNDIE